ncbi:hypothetical protein [Mycolicibacterium insubricum]|uniref:hypothetical protein n=1 Tax=Mycolicibacterium insubricum TaxID=444597 RepID=UPI0021F3713A|nr:hypothetical protein [Mycolicibacterium insubricum]MCV7082506.1 hypothetical protein [Mycolicibacterium insubricum]
MTVEPLAAVDAQTYWMASKMPSDQFLLYAFDGVPADFDVLIRELAGRAESCPDLKLRIVDDNRWRYPRWAPAPVRDGRFRRHDAPSTGRAAWMRWRRSPSTSSNPVNQPGG